MHFLIQNNTKPSRWGAPEMQTCFCLQQAYSPPSTLPPLSSRNLYLLHDAWKHTVFSYNFMWPLTSSAQMQYDLSATIHFGPWSGFNEFLLWTMWMSLGLALSFDVDRYQCALEMHHFKMVPLGGKNYLYVLCFWVLYHKKEGNQHSGWLFFSRFR